MLNVYRALLTTVGQLAVALSQLALAAAVVGVPDRSFGGEAAASVALALILGHGFAVPAERALTARIAAGAQMSLGWRMSRRLLWLPLAAVILPVLAAISGAGTDVVAWTAGLALAGLGWGLAAGIRGILAGHQQFAAYSLTLGVEALVRLVLVLGAVALPDRGQLWLAAALGVPLLAGAAAGRYFSGRPDPIEARSRLGRAEAPEQGRMTWIALSLQVCALSGPVWVFAGAGGSGAAAALLMALLYFRLPLVLVSGTLPVTVAAVTWRRSIGRPVQVDRRAGSIVVGIVVTMTAGGLLLLAGTDSVMDWAGVVIDRHVAVALVIATIAVAVGQFWIIVGLGAGRSGPIAVAWCLAAVAATVGFVIWSPDSSAISAVYAVTAWAGTLATGFIGRRRVQRV